MKIWLHPQFPFLPFRYAVWTWTSRLPHICNAWMQTCSCCCVTGRWALCLDKQLNLLYNKVFGGCLLCLCLCWSFALQWEEHFPIVKRLFRKSDPANVNLCQTSTHKWTKCSRLRSNCSGWCGCNHKTLQVYLYILMIYSMYCMLLERKLVSQRKPLTMDIYTGLLAVGLHC